MLGTNGVPFVTVEIPQDAVGIADYSFKECDTEFPASGWALELPETMRYIGDYAFYGCNRLMSAR